MANSHFSGSQTTTIPWISKLFLTDDQADLSLEASIPGGGPGTLAVVAVTSSTVEVLRGAATDRAPLRLTVPFASIPEESRAGSAEQASFLEPTDASKPGVYAVLWSGVHEVGPLSRNAWAGMSRLEGAPSPLGASLKATSGASLIPDGTWPISSMGPDAFLVVSSTTPERLLLTIINSDIMPPPEDAVYLARRGTRAVVGSPTWTLSPGAPSLGYLDISSLASESGSTVTVRRFVVNESQSLAVDIQALEDSSPITLALPQNITIAGITYTSIQFQWRDDDTLKLVAIQ